MCSLAWVQHFLGWRLPEKLLRDKAAFRYSHLSLREASEPKPGSGEGLGSVLGTGVFCWTNSRELFPSAAGSRKGGGGGVKRLLCRRLVMNSTKIRIFSGISGNGSVAQKVNTVLQTWWKWLGGNIWEWH